MQNIFTVLAGVVIVVVMAIVVSYFYMASKYQELLELWYTLRDKLRLRLDKLPLLVELLRGTLPEASDELNSLTDLKSKMWPHERPSAEVVHKHLEITHHLHALFKKALANDSLKHNVVFLSAQKDIQALHNEIEPLSEKYNEEVRKFNKLLKFPFIHYLFLAFKFKKLLIFEFEP